MDIDGALEKAFWATFVICFGVLGIIGFIGLIIATKGLIFIPILLFLFIFLGCLFFENKQKIFNKFKRGEK